MDVYTVCAGRTSRLAAVSAAAVERVQDVSSVVATEAILELVQDTLTGFYATSTEVDGHEAAAFHRDPELARLGEAAMGAVRAYRNALRDKPNVFRGWKRQPPTPTNERAPRR